eukprot:COSAG01_NODE_2716_length_7197_cov_385.352494_1_plen_144_part_00
MRCDGQGDAILGTVDRSLPAHLVKNLESMVTGLKTQMENFKKSDESQNSEKCSAGGIKIPYVPEKQSAATAEIERQLRRLVVFPRQRPPSERHSCAEVPVRRRDVRGVRLGPVAADPPSRHIRAPGGERCFEQVVSRAPSPDM